MRRRFKGVLKLEQNQLWRQGERHFRITRLERLKVEYREQAGADTKSGPPVSLSKKEFCRLIKGAELLPAIPRAKTPPPLSPGKKSNKD